MRTFKCRGGLANDEPLQPELVHPLQRLLDGYIEGSWRVPQRRRHGLSPRVSVGFLVT